MLDTEWDRGRKPRGGVGVGKLKRNRNEGCKVSVMKIRVVTRRGDKGPVSTGKHGNTLTPLAHEGI